MSLQRVIKLKRYLVFNFEPMAHPGGRPTVVTESVIGKLEEAYSNGASDTEACFIAGISKQALYDYQAKNPEFTDRKFALKEMIKYQAKSILKKKLDEKDSEMAKWYLERKGKDEGFSIRTEHTGKDGVDLLPKPIASVQRDDSVQENKPTTEED